MLFRPARCACLYEVAGMHAASAVVLVIHSGPTHGIKMSYVNSWEIGNFYPTRDVTIPQDVYIVDGSFTKYYALLFGYSYQTILQLSIYDAKLQTVYSALG